MCGIFGFVRNPNANTTVATAVLKELGLRSIERGRDSSGLALVPYVRSDGGLVTAPTKEQMNANFVDFEGTYIYKDVQPFDVFWRDNEASIIRDAVDSVVVMGHTRKATQGSSTDMANASPLATGSIIGTHNGDVDKYDVSLSAMTQTLHGSTDTEKLYAAVDRQDSHRAKIVRLLKDLPGRMALAWTDRTYPGRIYLARAAFSPLAIAWDSQGNLYWASNPSWFREIDTLFDGAVGFRDITMISEGRLMTVEFGEHIAPTVTNVRTFTPTARHSDEATADIFVWRGFAKEDEEADKALNIIHKVAPRKVSTSSRVSSPVSSGKTSTFSSKPSSSSPHAQTPFSSRTTGKSFEEDMSWLDDPTASWNQEPYEESIFDEAEYKDDLLRDYDPTFSYVGRNSYLFQNENDPFWDTPSAEKAFKLIDEIEWEYNLQVSDNVAAVFFDWAREGFPVGPILAVQTLREVQRFNPGPEQAETAVKNFMKDFGLTRETDAITLIELIRLYNNEPVARREAGVRG